MPENSVQSSDIAPITAVTIFVSGKGPKDTFTITKAVFRRGWHSQNRCGHAWSVVRATNMEKERVWDCEETRMWFYYPKEKKLVGTDLSTAHWVEEVLT